MEPAKPRVNVILVMNKHMACLLPNNGQDIPKNINPVPGPIRTESDFPLGRRSPSGFRVAATHQLPAEVLVGEQTPGCLAVKCT